MTQITFPWEQGQEALRQFLEEGDPDHDGAPMSRNIENKDGNDLAAVIIHPKHLDKLKEGYAAFQRAQDPVDGMDLPPGYRPYLHSPEATPNRLLPHEPLHKPLAHYLYGKPYGDLDQGQKDRLISLAITCLLRTTLDTDSQGVVPVMSYSHAPDDPEPRTYWQLAYKTDVPGLFLRGYDGFLSTEWGICTGSGIQVARGWWSREDAALAVSAIGRVLPYIDWMSAGANDLNDKSKAALKAVLLRYHFTGVREDKPEPDVVSAEDLVAGEKATDPADQG